MIDLNEHATEAQEIARERFYKKNKGYKTMPILKHAAGEVLEACEAYDDYFYNHTIDNREAFADELADIITCVLIAAANEKINIEKALLKCQQKNAQRAAEGSK